MILVIISFELKPDWADRWLDLVTRVTASTRTEEGNLYFEWSRSVDNPARYLAVEAYRDDDAVEIHLNSEYFREAMESLSKALASTPDIITGKIDATGWSKLAAMNVD